MRFLYKKTHFFNSIAYVFLGDILMIKRFSIKKISKYTIILLVVFLFYLLIIFFTRLIIFPEKESYNLDMEVSKNVNIYYHDIYLIDKNNYIAKTNIQVSSLKKDLLVDEIIELLKIDGKYQDKIPNGFRALLPCDTKLLGKEINNDMIILNFNSSLLDTRVENEEKIIESLIYSITSIDGINKVQIQIDGKSIDKLPKTGINIDKELTREYGINKIYDIDNIKGITKVTIYYINKKNNNDIYYIPVTKYINSDKDKIKIIIDELTSKFSFESNLMSYLNYNAKLINYNLSENEIDLNFNEYLFDSKQNQKVLEEVIYSISYSVMDNYKVNKVNFFINNEKITKWLIVYLLSIGKKIVLTVKNESVIILLSFVKDILSASIAQLDRATPF